MGRFIRIQFCFFGKAWLIQVGYVDMGGLDMVGSQLPKNSFDLKFYANFYLNRQGSKEIPSRELTYHPEMAF